MPTTHPRRATGATIAVTPLYFEKMEAQARAEQEAHPWRYTAEFDAAFWRNLRPFLTDPDMPVVWEEIRDELDAAAHIAAAHPLNPEGAYERILERERRREACCPKCGHHNWSDYEIEVDESQRTIEGFGYETRCHGCGYTADTPVFWNWDFAKAEA